MELRPKENGWLSPRFTLEQVIVLGTLMVGFAGSWYTTQSTLSQNRQAVEKAEAASRAADQELVNTNKTLTESLKLIRDNQITNESLIDQHSAEIEELMEMLKLPHIRHRMVSPIPRQ